MKAQGITPGEAVSYGIKNMITYLFIYIIGIAMAAFGIIVIVDNISRGMMLLGILLIISGAVFVTGALHGAVYKMAGDATARVINKSTITAKKESSTVDEWATSQQNQKEDTTSTTSKNNTFEIVEEENHFGGKKYLCGACDKQIEESTRECPSCKANLVVDKETS